MICFFHKSDNDGLASGGIIKYKYPDCKMIGIDYGDVFDWNSIPNGEKVFFVDFCPQPFNIILKLMKRCKINIIDHHKTTFEEFEKNKHLINNNLSLFGNMDQAGCELTWKYCFPDDDIPEIVKLLGRYDVFDKENSEWDTRILPFQYGIQLIVDTTPNNQKFWKPIFQGINTNDFIEEKVKEGNIILGYKTQEDKKYCKAFAFEVMFDGFRTICINKGMTNSQIFDSVYDITKHDIMLTFVKLKNKGWTASLYTTKNIDVSALAKKRGGGGHKQAAGFQCDDIFEELR